jgi:hypothetical protein
MKSFLKWLKKCFVPHEHNNYSSHFLRHQSISFFLFLIIVIEAGFFIQVFYVFDKTKFLAAVLPGVLTAITNEERMENNLVPLKENELLAKAAQLKAEDMALHGYFAHTSPNGTTPWYWFDRVGYKYIYAGENLAVNFFESVDVSTAWMNSPSHRANIIKPNYTEIGIGVANGTYQGRPTVFVAQLFGTPLPIAVAPKIETPVIVQAELEIPETEVAVRPAVTTPTVEPVSTVVLGEEILESVTEPTNNDSTPTPLVPVAVESIETQTTTESPVKISVQKILTSPRHLVTYAYTTIGLLALLAILLALFIKSELRHPGMMARGAGLIVVIIALSFINLKILKIEPQIPIGNLSANAIEALPR